MKLFTNLDVTDHGCVAGAGSIIANQLDLVSAPLDWQKQGLQQTSSGYGAKLTSWSKINFNGRLYRIYSTCYGNAASCWFLAKGRKIFVS